MLLCAKDIITTENADDNGCLTADSYMSASGLKTRPHTVSRGKRATDEEFMANTKEKKKKAKEDKYSRAHRSINITWSSKKPRQENTGGKENMTWDR